MYILVEAPTSSLGQEIAKSATDKRIEYRSARDQLANVSILDETDSHLNVAGLLFSSGCED